MNRTNDIAGVAEMAEVLVYAPLAGDGPSIAAVLTDAAIPNRHCKSLEHLEAALVGVPCPALCIVLSHEGSGQETGRILLDMREREPDWSSPPILILAATDSVPAYEMLVDAQSSPPPLVLSRPVQPRQFVSAVEIQVATRRRQFDVGSLLASLSESEKRQNFLLDELRHRTRNSLAVIRGMFSISARTAKNVETLVKEFEPRLTAMAEAHTALSEKASEKLPLDKIFRTHLAPFASSRSQLQIGGPDVQLQHGAAVDFAMIVHELATNAAKYGALSADTGKVDVGWEISDNGNLCIDWKESGGPPTQPPDREGLGTHIIRATGLSVAEAAELSFNESGLAWRLEMDPEHFTHR